MKRRSHLLVLLAMLTIVARSRNVAAAWQPMRTAAVSPAARVENSPLETSRAALLESHRLLLEVRPFDFAKWKSLLETAYSGSAPGGEIAWECRRFALLLGDSLAVDSVMVVLDSAVRIDPDLAFDDSLLDLCKRVGRQPPSMTALRERAEEEGKVVDPTLPKLGEYVYVEVLPEAISKVAPDYPASARRANIQGTVLMQVLVGNDGHVADAKVVKSIPELDDAAIAAVRQWIFKPATTKGQPVAVWVAVPMKFTLSR